MLWNFKKSVYLDYNATTPPDKLAIKAFQKGLDFWGNPSSVHQASTKAKYLLWESRKKVSHFIGCHPLEIIFTSGASEANNFVLKGLFEKYQGEKNELIVSAVEHPSLMQTADYLSQKGCKVHKIPVSRQGQLDLDFFEKCLSEKTLLVSIMMANNETGVLNDLAPLIEKTKSKGGYFHSDMVQSLGKIPVNLGDLKLDFASFSAHKFYGLKGCGALYCKKGTSLESLIHGGPQERSRRAGTENLPGIAAFGAVSEKGDVFLKSQKKILELRDQMEKDLISSIPDIEIIGSKLARLNNTSSIFISGIEGETLLMNLDLKGFFVSVGSACNSGKISSSSVLSSMGFTEKEARSCIRISLGFETQKKDIQGFVKTLKNVIERLRSLED